MEFQIFCQIFSPTPVAEWLLEREESPLPQGVAAVSRVEVEVDWRVEIAVEWAVDVARAQGCRARACRHKRIHLTQTTLYKHHDN